MPDKKKAARDAIPLYACHTAHCTLGIRGEPGHFTGGITAEGLNNLTGEPVEAMKEGKDYGEGFCPNCGEKGERVGAHEPLPAGDDPLAAHHEAVAAKFAPLIAEANAEGDTEYRDALKAEAEAEFAELVAAEEGT